MKTRDGKVIPVTIFGEEIFKGDRLMYVYTVPGNTFIAFGTVEDIRWSKERGFRHQQFSIKLRTDYVLKGFHEGPCDRIVLLWHITCLKVGAKIKHPADKPEGTISNPCPGGPIKVHDKSKPEDSPIIQSWLNTIEEELIENRGNRR
jgi:hypothetical protein